MKFKGKVAFIIGASRGVGKNIALAKKAGSIVAAAKTEATAARIPGTIHETVAAGRV
jgi:NAD(P)-dependent dehydrogenase (short-subunit alcohol dehydrogenase family)